MDHFSISSCDDSPKPPVPRSRRPLRDIVSNESESHTFRNYKYQNQEYFNRSKSDDPYTDDDDDDDDNKNSSFSFLDKTNYTPESLSVNSSFNKPSGGLNIYIWIAAFICLMSFAVYLIMAMNKDKEDLITIEKVNLTVIDNILTESIKIIQTKFHNQRVNIWDNISAAIYDVALRPSIILLFGTETDTLNCLAELLGQLSARILGSHDYLTLTPRDFPNDIGQTLNKLKPSILAKRAVVVKELLNINAEAVKAFHNFCDRTGPLVKNAIYIITITVNGYNSSQKELEFISKQMSERLSSYIDEDILQPLITRVTDGAVVSILPESSTSFNHTYCSMN